MIRITLRQLAVFDAIARSGSVSKAAEAISLSQSAASMSLGDLERNLGIKLFSRRGKKLALTENGRRYLPEVHALLQQASDLEALHDEPNLRGALRIGAGITIGNYVLPKICGQFIRDHPEVNIALTIAEPPEIARQLEAMNLDIGFVENPLDRPALQSTSWISDEMLVFCSPTHPLANRRKIAFAQLKDELWVLGNTRTTLNAVLAKHVGVVRIRLETSGLEAMKRAVIASNGIGCLSRFALEADFRAGTLRQLRVADLSIQRNFRIMTLRGGYLGKVHRTFLDTVLAEQPRRDPGQKTARRRAQAEPRKAGRMANAHES